MRALFLTSGPTVRGLTSDDGFAIGLFDALATLNLLAVGTVIGVIGAFVYLAVRPFLIGPRWLRWTTCSLAAGAVIGPPPDFVIAWSRLRPAARQSLSAEPSSGCHGCWTDRATVRTQSKNGHHRLGGRLPGDMSVEVPQL